MYMLTCTCTCTCRHVHVHVQPGIQQDFAALLYRARVEHLIKELGRGRKTLTSETLNTKWRGDFALLAAIINE